MSKKLWTGKTAKQELHLSVTLAASVHGYTINDALEHALDGAERCPDGSPKREGLRWWDGASASAQQRFLSNARSEVRASDRLMGRNHRLR